MIEDIDIIIWDLETTGFVAPESRILEIGAFIIRGDVIEHRQWVLNNQCEIPEKITEITGITKEIIEAEGKDPKECLEEFLPLLKAAKKNVTHNGIRFDIPFLVAYAEDVLKLLGTQKGELSELLRERAFDTAVYFKASKLRYVQNNYESYIEFAERVMNTRAVGLKFNLLLCCQEKGVDMTGITLHRAMADVQMTHELYKLIHKNENQII